MRLGLIGYGAIAHDICYYLDDDVEVIGALVLPEDLERTAKFPLVTELQDLLDLEPDLIAECAGHSAVANFGPAILEADIDLMIISIGALSDEALYRDIKASAERSKAQVLLPAGALIGVDGLSASLKAGLDYVEIESTKPPLSWEGAEGVEGIDLAAISERTVIFEGSAREAARLFPKNANVAATAALAGIGMEATHVRLVAHPATDRNSHRIKFGGKPGDFEIVVRGNPSPVNPKTSQLTALNIVRSIEQRTKAIVI